MFYVNFCAATQTQAHVSAHHDQFCDHTMTNAITNTAQVETVGDVYLVCAGCPLYRPDHGAALAYLALDMQVSFLSRPVHIPDSPNATPVILIILFSWP